MSPEDNKRSLLDFAFQLHRNEPMSDSQRDFLSIVLYRIATGEDANKVLGTEGGRGEGGERLLGRVLAAQRLQVLVVQRLQGLHAFGLQLRARLPSTLATPESRTVWQSLRRNGAKKANH
mgnify:CR=1 FL=1